jgi:hypothetical protein
LEGQRESRVSGGLAADVLPCFGPASCGDLQAQEAIRALMPVVLVILHQHCVGQRRDPCIPARGIAQHLEPQASGVRG